MLRIILNSGEVRELCNVLNAMLNRTFGIQCFEIGQFRKPSDH